MNINLRTGKVNEAALEKENVSIKQFWRIYLTLLTVRDGVESFKSKEMDVLIYLLTNDLNVSHFEGDYRKVLCDELNIRTSELNIVLKELVRKGVLVKPDKNSKRGKWYLSSPLKSFYKLVYSKKQLTFVFPLMVNNG